MAIVDADLKFIYIDVGRNGRMSDGGVWRDCSLKTALDNGDLNIPVPTPLPHDPSQEPFRFTFVADAAFGLTLNIQKPYPITNRTVAQRIHDYRVSRARRTSENAFGLITSRFGCLETCLRVSQPKATQIVKAICVLHNLLRSKKPANYSPEHQLARDDLNTRRFVHSTLDGSGAGALVRLRRVSNNPTVAAKMIRDRWTDYFAGPGAVSWQLDMI